MFVCAVDGCSRSLNLVLTVHPKDQVPRWLEGRRLRRSTARGLRRVFQEWREFYGAEIERVVCSSADVLPAAFLEALHTVGGQVEWVEQDSVRRVLDVWSEIVPPARWLRGAMTALVATVPPPARAWWTLEKDYREMEGYHWVQAWFRGHLDELEYRDEELDRMSETIDAGWEGVPF